MVFEISIDRDRCIKCLRCVRYCPTEALGEEDKMPVVKKQTACVGCGNCVDVCPAYAIQVSGTSDLEDRGIWSRSIVHDIWLKAETGTYLVRGTGATRPVPHFDDLVILPAQTSRPPIDKYREPCNTRVVLGDRYAEEPLVLETPIMVAAMSFGAISLEAKVAIAIGTAMAGTATNTGEGGMHPEERKHAKLLIAQYASGRFGVSAKYLNDADGIEIKIGQGAKAGMGGHLLGEKVTEEIAMIRGIPPGTDALSPARHMDIIGPEDLAMKIEQLREITDWRIPIAVKYSAGRVADDVKIAAKAGADIIVVDGMQGGTGATPDVVANHAGIPTIAAIVQADQALREIGLRDKVSLVAAGGIRTGADVAKALALGADAVQIGTGALIALGCTVCRQCHIGKCPKGIATQDPKLRRRLDPQKGGIRVYNYIKAMTEELKILTQQAGKTDVRNLEMEDLRALTINASAITGVKLVGWDKPFRFP
ncbi:ferredoxin-dependent glutamate synthase [Ferroglobus placidus DSM 10642]|uniref:Archaeal glutamate synthase [NADPH] n=1 Tax=Ferroglobus placidus (strain DSM 10642 / AEDII12DO) TaxID=589924 RepID=D3RZ98_FERPA|nr:glutamate synthase-related protein [Ferroglobus placidus]ADC65811.1 ferredoxin-dependent glutamate synthase [Ferroglobus placidus DSM 10642]